MLVYASLCIISIMMGRGFLRLIRLQIDNRLSLYLSPIVTLCLWSVFLGWTVQFGFTVKQVWIYGFLATASLALLGVGKGDIKVFTEEWKTLLFIILAPIALMLPYFTHGITVYPGSPTPDGWSYIAFGQYLWEYPSGTRGGLAPLYQYASHLVGTRFIGSALLGYFSPLVGTPGDTQAASGIYLSWAIFVFSASCMFFARTSSLSTRFRLIYVAVSIVSGYLLNLLTANNYDNALILGFMPVFAGLINIAFPKNLIFSIVFGLLISGTIYCYPELSIFIYISFFCFLISRLIRASNEYLDWIILFLTTTCIIALISIPTLPSSIHFFISQLHSTTTTQLARPGEGIFSELINPWCIFSAIWGFKGGFIDNFVASILAIFTILGLPRLYKHDMLGILLTFTILSIGTIFMILYLKYDYGAYKLLLLNWWCLSFICIYGLAYTINTLSTHYHNLFISILLVPYFSLLIYHINNFTKTVSHQDLAMFQEISKARELINNNMVIADIANPIVNDWIVYFFRDISIYFVTFYRYMAQAHIVPLIKESKQIDLSKTSYLLTDTYSLPNTKSIELVWQSGLFKLARIKERHWALLTHIENPNGIENWEGERGFWIGEGETKINFYSTAAGQIAINGVFSLGPCLPERSEYKLLIDTDQDYKFALTIYNTDTYIIRIPVHRGDNAIRFRSLDKPTSNRLANGDTRPLLIGVRGLCASFLPQNLENPH